MYCSCSLPHVSETSLRLAKKIKRDTGMECDPHTFVRTYAGSCQKAAGAFIWTMKCKDSAFVVGSIDLAVECIKSKNKLVLTDLEITAGPIDGAIQ